MIWLAIDPGPERSGYVRYRAGEILDSGIDSNENVLNCDDLYADRLVIEMVAHYGMAVGKEVFETCVWIGRFLQDWSDPDKVVRLTRLQVKMHLCHSVRAKDSNVWQALIDRFGDPGTKFAPGKLYGLRSHTRAALALAVTADDQDAQRGELEFAAG